MTARERLPDRRANESFTFELNGLRFTATVSRFPDGRIGCDGAILLSFALQHGADIESIRRSLCRDSQGRALGPIAEALDIVAGRP